MGIYIYIYIYIYSMKIEAIQPIPKSEGKLYKAGDITV